MPSAPDFGTGDHILVEKTSQKWMCVPERNSANKLHVSHSLRGCLLSIFLCAKGILISFLLIFQIWFISGNIPCLNALKLDAVTSLLLVLFLTLPSGID